MYALITFLSFIALLLVLIGIHELGHFATARFFGIAVEEFGFGFPPRLWARRGRSGTLYSINAIPLGGFVRMKGENGEAFDPNSFGAKPAWQRAIVLCAGAAMNLFGALLLSSSWSTLWPRSPWTRPASATSSRARPPPACCGSATWSPPWAARTSIRSGRSGTSPPAMPANPPC